ncbi:hypothetical protein NY2A_b447R [Paramecium bursaria Chlorella virus NY2A]|uniref:Uncharacterized protein b447R n=1 Tax=Paramecium bursaria Chlorella virus NY2A TaxID=46021 RepID=A7IWX2_PBCVN|nr:hypothetical protein NY2A_b447R [Paramecium bursaria Chlorella virus NY2A]ABT14846.1 hypothetical protein NY2A_b447R [Paramecium bursaria Chlorella virus NY2A]
MMVNMKYSTTTPSIRTESSSAKMMVDLRHHMLIMDTRISMSEKTRNHILVVSLVLYSRRSSALLLI